MASLTTNISFPRSHSGTTFVVYVGSSPYVYAQVTNPPGKLAGTYYFTNVPGHITQTLDATNAPSPTTINYTDLWLAHS